MTNDSASKPKFISPVKILNHSTVIGIGSYALIKRSSNKPPKLLNQASLQNGTARLQEKINELKHKVNLSAIGMIIGTILFMVGYFLGRTPYYVWENTYGLNGPFLDIVTSSSFIGTCLLLGLGLLFVMAILVVYYSHKRKKLLSQYQQYSLITLA